MHYEVRETIVRKMVLLVANEGAAVSQYQNMVQSLPGRPATMDDIAMALGLTTSELERAVELVRNGRTGLPA